MRFLATEDDLIELEYPDLPAPKAPEYSLFRFSRQSL
jgi:hypothetical protein